MNLHRDSGDGSEAALDSDLVELWHRRDYAMRLLSVATATVVTALVLANAASAGLWLNLDRVTATPGQTVHGKAVSPCGACGPGPLFLVPTSNAALQLLKRVPRGDPRFVPVGRFTWKRGGRFAFEVPQVRPGFYQLMALYRNGPAWSAAPASTLLRVQASSRVSFDVSQHRRAGRLALADAEGS